MKEGGLRSTGISKHSGTQNPLISILTIVRNGEKTIEQTIQSVITQNYPNIEYVVLDAASTDGTIGIIKKYSKKIDYWRSEPDRGISDGMNKGIRLCTGEYIGMIHADDWYEPDTVSKIAKRIRCSRVDVICGRMQMWENNKKSYIFTSDPSKLPQTMSANHPTCFIAKSAYEKYGLYSTDFKYGMDYELLLRFQAKGAKFDSLDAILANMRAGGNSASARSARDGYKARVLHIPGSFYASRAYYYFQYAKALTSSWLQKTGLTPVLSFYRKYLARVKKYKNT